MYCINGHPMQPGERFCGVCGAGLAAVPMQPAKPAGSTPVAWWVLGVAIVAIAAGAIFLILSSSDPETPASQSSLPAVDQTTLDSTTSPVSSPPTSNASATTVAATSSTIGASTSSTTTSTTTTLPGPQTVVGSSWQAVTGGSLAGDGGQQLSDVVATAGGYVAVGLDGPSAIWTSPDAVTWTKRPADPALAGTQMSQVEKAPDGSLVAVGRRLGPTLEFMAWTSPDGLAWTEQAPATGNLPAGSQGVTALAAHPDGFVAVGLVDNGGDLDAAWWTSPDGVAWTAHTIAEPGLQQMLGVAVSNGVMIAAGEARPNTGIWRAPIGQPFARVDDVNLTTAVSDFDPSNVGARVFAWDVAASGPGFIAVGADQTTAGRSMAAVWSSTDGNRWLRYGNETEATPNMANANFAGNGAWTVMDTVLDSNGTTLAIGRTGNATDPDIAVWESPDGFTWKQGPVASRPTPQRALRAIAMDGRVVAVGADGAVDGTGDAAVWILAAGQGGGPIQNTACDMRWTVQSGTARSAGAGVLSAAITPIDRAKSFLVFSARHTVDRPVASVRGRIAPDGRSVEFVRETDETSAVDIAWHVVTYPCGVTVQHGELTAGPPTSDVALSPIASTDQAFVLWSKSVEATNGFWSDDDPTVAEITSTTNLQFRHSGVETAHVISWQVVEFTDPATISVQRGSTSILGPGLVATVTLPQPADLTRAFPLVSFRMNDGTLGNVGAHLISARLVDSTTLVVERSTAGDNDIEEILWEVVELKDGSAVAHDDATLASGAASDVFVVPSFAADAAYAFTTVQGSNGQSIGRTPYAVEENTGVASFTVELIAPNQLRLTRAVPAAPAGVGWVVVRR